MAEQGDRDGQDERRRRKRAELTAQSLEELALSYVARFSTTAKKLEMYCHRKLRERGWSADERGGPPVDAIVARLVEKGYVDDAAYARMRSEGLLRRGYGERRVEQALFAVGVAETDRIDIGVAQARHAALHMAKKRHFGPFGRDGRPEDRAVREKQVAAMLRAGHSLDSARQLTDARTIEAATSWAHEYDEDEQ